MFDIIQALLVNMDIHSYTFAIVHVLPPTQANII